MDNNKKQIRNQPNDHRSLDGIITIPQSLGHQSRLNLLGDTTSGLCVDDTEVSRTTKGQHMRLPKTREQKLAEIFYWAGYLLAVVTLIKFGWWVWQQPW
jgi:hypothetical protein